MFCQRTKLFRTAALVLCAAALSLPARAAEVAAGETCCFSALDFEQGDGTLAGICVTGLPEGGGLRLGARVVRSGDILTAEQLDSLTFSPAPSDADATGAVSYLPIYTGGVGAEAEMVISIRGQRDDAPTAEDSAIETYKNLPGEGLLKVSDPEGQPMTYTLVRAPRRGEVVLREDGSFLYTPKKNKVGTDSFTFTATDPAGNVSREATVTIEILKPTSDELYTDTASSECRFEAEWLRNTGIFCGESVSGEACFSPEKEVTRGQFLAMLMETLELPVDRSAQETAFLDESPDWLKPYLAAALRSGIISGYPVQGGVEFRADQPVSADEAAIMVQNAVNYAVPAAALDGTESTPLALPTGSDALTRSDAAVALYRISKLREESSDFTVIFR